MFRDVRKILEELLTILAPDDGHKKVFLDIPMISLKKKENKLKGTLSKVTITKLG